MDTVTTAIGDLPRAKLLYHDTVTEDAVAVYTAREWFHDGEMVRRDAWVDMKRGVEAELQKGM